MLKGIILIALSTLVSAAQAETVTAQTATGCTTWCQSVPNDADLTIAWQTPYGANYNPSHNLGLQIGSDVYYSAPHTIGNYQTSYSDLVLTDSAGDTITVSATWSAKQKCGAGRAGGCTLIWTLLSGEIVTQ